MYFIFLQKFEPDIISFRFPVMQTIIYKKTYIYICIYTYRQKSFKSCILRLEEIGNIETHRNHEVTPGRKMFYENL